MGKRFVRGRGGTGDGWPLGDNEMIDGVRVIDFHSHTNQNESLGMLNDPGRMLHAMDMAGIDTACINHTYHLEGTRSNDITARFVQQHPERFKGVAYVSPVMAETMISELTRAIDKLCFIAIKLYPPSTPWDLNRKEWFPIYRFADERKLPILFHTSYESRCYPKYLGDVAPRFPGAIFVAGHSGNTAEGRSQAIAAAIAHSNVYLETCSSFRTPGAIEELVEMAGADKVLFGSDIPLMDPRSQLGKIVTARISDEAKRKVLGGNARRILKL